MRGRDDLSRHGDNVVLDFYMPGKHMLMGGVITSHYKDNCPRSTTTISLGYAAR
jgi:hypothetical protein